MGYSLNAVIGCTPALHHLSSNFKNAKALNLHNELYIMPMSDELFDEINNYKPSNHIGSFIFLNERIANLLAAASEDGTIAYFEADYFGGTGYQSSIVWVNQDVVFSEEKSKDAFNKSLKLMGVRKKEGCNEFETVGLNRFRGTEEWLELSEKINE